jgi:hypothetical protein
LLCFDLLITNAKLIIALVLIVFSIITYFLSSNVACFKETSFFIPNTRQVPIIFCILHPNDINLGGTNEHIIWTNNSGNAKQSSFSTSVIDLSGTLNVGAHDGGF